MNENFDNNINNAENQAETTSNPIYERPVTPPVTPPGAQYTPPVYNQYATYGNYGQPPKPEAPKKESKGKKKGFVVAIVIICAVFLAAVGVFLAGFIFDGFSEEVPKDKDNTQMQITDTPAKNDDAESNNGALTPKQVYSKVYESSVGVLVYTSNQQTVYSEGTGIVMGENADGNATYIITCAHVIDVANPKILVQTEDGTQYDAVVVGKDAKTDIGLIRISATGLKAAEFADSDILDVGDYVYAIGNPGGTQFFGSFTNGMVSAIGRPVNSPVGYEVACIQHTAAINPGNSGGALVNEFGQVIGINSSKIASTEYEGMGFAVPSTTVKQIVDELIAHGKVTNRPVLGITYYASTYSQTHSIIVKTHNLPSNSIIIEEIMIGSDLANKGVKSGDMIIAVNGKDMDNDDVLLDLIENGKVGDELTLTICRIDSNYNISKFDVTVKLVEDSSTSQAPQQEENNSNPFPFPFGE